MVSIDTVHGGPSIDAHASVSFFLLSSKSASDV
jgi:hypothetical protein